MEVVFNIKYKKNYEIIEEFLKFVECFIEIKLCKLVEE